jgi:hypothetical protein
MRWCGVGKSSGDSGPSVAFVERYPRSRCLGGILVDGTPHPFLWTLVFIRNENGMRVMHAEYTTRTVVLVRDMPGSERPSRSSSMNSTSGL